MPTPQEQAELDETWSDLEQHIVPIQQRIDQMRELTYGDVQFAAEIQNVALGISALQWALDQFDPADGSRFSAECFELRDDIIDILYVLEPFTEEALASQRTHTLANQQAHAFDTVILQRNFLHLINNYTVEIDAISNRGSERRARRILEVEEPDVGNRATLELLLKIHEGLGEYWCLWGWVYAYPTVPSITYDG